MRIIILAIVLILSIAFVSAEYQKTTERITLEEGQSTDFNGKRITLLNLDFENEKVVVCVNGERTILGLRKTKTLSEAMLELKKVTMNKAEIRIWVNCPECKCDGSCDNSACFDECYEDKDCDDKDALTEDRCYGTPKRCHNKKIKDCNMDSHCDDGNSCTTDRCSETGECTYYWRCEEEKTPTSLAIQSTEKYAQTIHPLLLSLAFGFMIIAMLIKKFKY